MFIFTFDIFFSSILDLEWNLLHLPEGFYLIKNSNPSNLANTGLCPKALGLRWHCRMCNVTVSRIPSMSCDWNSLNKRSSVIEVPLVKNILEWILLSSLMFFLLQHKKHLHFQIFSKDGGYCLLLEKKNPIIWSITPCHHNHLHNSHSCNSSPVYAFRFY